MAQTLTDLAGNVRSGTRSKFFLGISVTLLLVVFLGFAPTFYLQAAFERPSLPLYLHVHGFLLTAWYSLLVVQTSLIAARRTQIHKRLGVFGAAVAAGVVAICPVVLRGAREHNLAAYGVDFMAMRAAGLYHYDVIILAGFSSLIVFATLVSCAFVFRGSPETHKRLMLLASIAIIGPALTGVRMFGALLSQWLPIDVAMTGIVLLVLAVVVHDLRSLGRISVPTLWGGLAISLLTPITTFVSSTNTSHAIVDWLTN